MPTLTRKIYREEKINKIKHKYVYKTLFEKYGIKELATAVILVPHH